MAAVPERLCYRRGVGGPGCGLSSEPCGPAVALVEGLGNRELGAVWTLAHRRPIAALAVPQGLV